MNKEYLVESAEYEETSEANFGVGIVIVVFFVLIGLLFPLMFIFAIIALFVSFKSTTTKKWTGKCPKCQKNINFIGDLGTVFKDGFNGGKSENLKNTRNAEFNCPSCKSKLILNDSKFVYKISDIDRL